MAPEIPRIGPMIQKERKARKLTLEQLANMSGVSRSMLSQVERGEANPTFAVLWSLTQALKLEFSELIGGSAARANPEPIEITSAAHTPEIKSADGSCRLKILSTPRLAGHTEWYEVTIEPGGWLDSDPHAHGAFEHFTALAGEFDITSGETSARLKTGETARYPVDVSHTIANAGDTTARGFLVVLYG